MITSIKVDGFRSLVRFSLDLRPGLNLLVGPNGGGKTNIISFLGFLSELAKSDLSSIVSHLGGSGAVFRKLGANRYQSRIKATIEGHSKADVQFRLRFRDNSSTPEDNRTLYFQYAFTLQLSEDRESVFFAQQSLKLRLTEASNLDAKDIKEWDAHLSVSGRPDGSVSCQQADMTAEFKQEFRPIRSTRESSPEQAISQMLTSDVSLLVVSYSVLPSEFGVPFLSDFRRGMIFNPHPSRIRLPEDSAKPPGIRADGSGLYASLFAIKRGIPKTGAAYRTMWFRAQEEVFVSSVKLDRLMEFFRLAYPQMASLTVTNDQFENTIRVRVTLEGREKSQIPLATLSDGTLKWMAFVTAIFSNSNILAIEEPENFVHPFVQREAIKLVRDHLQNTSYMFMSSHSETILNAAEPEEVIVVGSKGSRTVARRVENPGHLRELIGETGFGLGFYYLAGALEDA